MFTVRQGINTLPPLARFVTSPLHWCISNYGFYYKSEETPKQKPVHFVTVYVLFEKTEILAVGESCNSAVLWGATKES